MREKKVEEYLKKQVEQHGGLCEKHVSPGQRGVPDRLVTWPDGCMQLVETKAPEGRLADHQIRDHDKRQERLVWVEVLWTREQVDDYITRNVWHWNKRS